MQDLGVCEDLFSMMILTYRMLIKEFATLKSCFGGDLDPIGAFLDENDLPCSSVEKDMPLEKSNNRDGRARKVWF
jgi:hypothetical protein